MRRLLITLLIAPILLAAGAPVRAQADAPLIVYLDGDFWAWDASQNGLRPLTIDGYNSAPILSPDGTFFAFTTVSPAAAEAAAAGRYVLGDSPPTDLWLWDLTTGRARAVDLQWDSASFGRAAVPDQGVIRGTPAWSPDGCCLAWQEYSFPDGGSRLMRYDLANSHLTAIVPDFPLGYQDAGLRLQPIQWTAAGIVFANITTLGDGVPAGPGQERLTYDRDGHLIAREESLPVDAPRLPGASLPTQPLRETYSPNAPATSLGLIPLREAVDGGVITTWWVIAPDGTAERVEAATGALSAAIAPDGQAAAFAAEGVIVWREGRTIHVPGTAGATRVIWGPLAGREIAPERLPAVLPPTLTPQPAPMPEPCALVGQLAIGARAVVRPDAALPSNVYADDGHLLDRLPPGSPLTVMDGPLCAAFTVWWRIAAADGLNGWAIEGQGDGLPQLVATQCPGELPVRLHAGDRAEVQAAGASLRVRAQPSNQGAFRFSLAAGETLRITSGPVCGPEGTWWSINQRQGTGWVRAFLGDEYTLVPVVD